MGKKFNVDEAFTGKELPRAEGAVASSESKLTCIRLHKDEKEALKLAFRGMGLTLSSGIRTVLYEWLRRQR